MSDIPPETWAVAAAYDAYVGRWSRPVAAEFLRRLALAPGLRWLDVGCGTGALTSRILALTDPAGVVGLDPSAQFLGTARRQTAGDQARFLVGDAQALPVAARSVDAVVSGLALNFVPDPRRAVAEFARVTVGGGTVAAYVWDYADRMTMIRTFWDAAVGLDPDAAPQDEARRFPLCHPEPLGALWTDAGLADVTVTPIDVPLRFVSFDDYWEPFLGGQGPAPGYVRTLSPERRRALRGMLAEQLGAGPVTLTGGAWTVRGRVG
ncbi:class I SAM-dependent methyltransferase [Cryptosporangium minutisporangium]|uniref:Class I SAM-dependent methyltransferase n=1 Tax=Cryptosporangium minutisporangium TaxID=113569 RepID=A0ABP6TAD6_9ACTN